MMTIKSEKPMGARVLAAVLLPLALLLAVFAINAGSASAATGHNYCGGVIGPQAQCGGGAHTNLQGNVALYPGTGSTLKVCQYVVNHTLGQVNSSCGINGTGSASNVSFWLGHNLTPFVQNGSTVNAHTVNGIWFSP